MQSRMEKPSNGQTPNDFLKKYGKYIAVIAVALILIIIIVFSGRGSSPAETTAANTEVIGIPADEETETTADATALKEDAYPAVNELINNYFTALKNQDLETLSNIMTTESEITAEDVQKEGEYIEDYQNIKCYTRDGIVDGTYIVFAYYDIKFLNVDTLAPSMIWMYVCTNEDGSLYINKSTIDGEVAAYIDEVLKSDEVNALAESVNSALSTAMEQDETLAQLVTKMREGADPSAIEESQTEETQAEETQAEETQPSESQTEETQAEETQPESEQSSEGTETVYALQNVRIRRTPSTDGEVAGQLVGGSSIQRVGTEGEWSRVIYNGEECYIASEFLTTSAAAGSYFEEVDEYVQALQNVKMRSQASTDSEDLGTLPGGTEVHRTGYNEEWSRIEYNGETCYVASEFLG